LAERNRDELQPVRDVTVSIDIERGHDIDELEQRFQDKEMLTDNEIMSLLRANRIDGTDIEDYLDVEEVMV